MNEIKSLFSAMEVSASGLAAQRKRLNAISENLANAGTTRTEEGGPYRRKVTRFVEAPQHQAFRRTLEAQEIALDMSRTSSGHMESDERRGEAGTVSGVRADVQPDDAPPVVVYDPSHPDADENGYVKMPNVNVVQEMVDLISATRNYEANVTAVKSFKEMTRKALEI